MGLLSSELWPPTELRNFCWRSLEKWGGELQKEMLLGEAGIEGIECLLSTLVYLLSTPVPVPHQAMSSLGREVHSFLALL